MTDQKLDPAFSAAVRATLTELVATGRGMRKRRDRLRLGIGIAAASLVLSGGGVAVAGILINPGADEVATQATAVVETHTGTAAVDLGTVPKAATHISIQFACLSASTFTFSGGTSVACSPSDVGTDQGDTTFNLPLDSGQHSVQVTTDPTSSWRLTATYVSVRTAEWGINANGETFGVQNEKGTPDLVSVIATNGLEGYVYADALAHAEGNDLAFNSPADAAKWSATHKGTNTSIPAYESDGTSKVGVFVVGS